MTGFARAEGQSASFLWSWEIRSVNARGLEIRCRLPVGFESLELPARERVARRCKRGSVNLVLSLSRAAGPPEIRLNADVLREVVALARMIREQVPDCGPPSVDGLLAVRGVIDMTEDQISGELRNALEEDLIAGLEQALSELAGMRADEGGRLKQLIEAQLARIGDLCAQADSLAGAQPQTILDRLRQQVAALLDAGVGDLPEERLAQEVVVLAAKADPREELDRLRSHRHAADLLLHNGNGPVGRKLEFLCQELNREANTLCSKSADIRLTQLGVELKTVIDQMREQVQNIE
jgi:uncharacterized protein (TIGR00255 family)